MKVLRTLLRLVALLALFLGSQPVSASHVAGGEITYEFIGDSTGVPFHYLIELRLYRSTAGVNLPNSVPIDIESSCYANSTITLQSSGYAVNAPVPGFMDCVDSNVTVTPISYFGYGATVVLPGPCADYVFSWNLCCRNSSINNLATYPSLYLESQLNNSNGPNNSPQFIHEGAKVFCMNEKVSWSHTTEDPDGDSLFYEIAQPLRDGRIAVPWAPGYSTSDPITTSTGINFNPATGLMRFIPIQAEICVFRISVSEYRFDTTLSAYVKVGNLNREAQVVISNACTFPPKDSLALQISNPGPGGVSDIPCNTAEINFDLDQAVICSSISPDGSDFAIFDSRGFLMPIQSAGTKNCQGNLTNDIYIKLHNQVWYNDTIVMVTRIGNDSNTIVTSCAGAVPEFDSLELVITSCSTDISQSEYQLNYQSLYPNPAREEIRISNPPADSWKYEIIDLTGRVWKVGRIKGPEALDISDLPQGNYVLKFINKEVPEYLHFNKL